VTHGRARLRRAAVADAEVILDHLAGTSPGAALRFAAALEEAIRRLEWHPRIGHPVGSRIPVLRGLRTWPVPGFPSVLLLHVPAPGGVVVLRVVHGARDLEALRACKEEE
jgi:toxin ParE1/3/4